MKRKLILGVVDKLPDRINPKINLEWAFISYDYRIWFWHKDKWITRWGNMSFPSFSMMTGIQKISKKERKTYIDELSYYSIYKKY